VKLLSGPFIRSVEGENLLEIFFVTAVAGLLGIRFFLAATGYPQLSGKGLHIAHVLLGGLLMMLALIITLAYINKSAHYVAAFLGGFGFGAFIDELGKFITGDNDYFFKPTVALIYIIFVFLYLGVEAFVRRPALTGPECLINVLEIAKEIALGDLDHRERKKGLELLKGCDPSDPVAKSLKTLLYAANSVPVPRPNVYIRAKYRSRRLYRRLVQKRLFVSGMIVFFLLQSFLALALDILLLYAKLRWRIDLHALFPSMSFIDLAGLASATLAAILVVAAILKLQKDRLKAYQLFKNAVLIQILLVQVFLFYRAQFLALLGLAGNICVLLVLFYMIDQEKDSNQE
jgi:hypothetical protein